MHTCDQTNKGYTRRDFLTRTSLGLGAAAFSQLLGPTSLQAKSLTDQLLRKAPKAKRIIYLFQSGAPSHLELFDYKPTLFKMQGEELPASVRGEQRLTGMSAGQKSFPLVPSFYDFKQHGESGAWVSELMPHTAEIVDELCFVKSMHTEAINHDPAVTFMQTGSQQPGRPSFGSWVSYGLGSEGENLPAFCVLLSEGKPGGQPLYARSWGNGFLPSQYQGVQFRSGNDAVLYLGNPPGIDDASRRVQLDHLKALQQIQYDNFQDPEIVARIEQYEMAYRMQNSVPELMDLSGETQSTYAMYGDDAKIPGTFAANCLLSRRLAERGVRFIQLYHQGWDQHGNLPKDIKRMADSTDQASAALVKDLKQRGMLDDTLVIWGGEFGRTNYSQGQLTSDNFGRDHHPRCFSIWMAGGGVKPGMTYGQTDEFGYNVAKDAVHVHDFHATVMHLLGVDHEQLTFKHQGRRYRLTDQFGKVVDGVMA